MAWTGLSERRAYPRALVTAMQTQDSVVAFALVDFLTLVTSQSVEGRCWGEQFTISPDLLNAMRDFASRLNPKTQVK
jgi:hypothetical protein